MDLQPNKNTEGSPYIFSNLTDSDKLLLCEVMRRRISKKTSIGNAVSGDLTEDHIIDIKSAAAYIDDVHQGITTATSFEWGFITEIMEITISYIDDLAMISRQLGSTAYGAISDRVRIQEAGMAAVELFQHSEIDL